MLLLHLELIWLEVQDGVYEPGTAQTHGLTKYREQDEMLHIADTWVQITMQT